MNILTITDAAWRRVKELIDDPGFNPNKYKGLRIKVVGGGCSGLRYKTDLSEERSGDFKLEKDGYFIFIDRKSLLYLNGMEIDYRITIASSSFHFANPNVKRTCGCGESFSA